MIFFALSIVLAAPPARWVADRGAVNVPVPECVTVANAAAGVLAVSAVLTCATVDTPD